MPALVAIMSGKWRKVINHVRCGAATCVHSHGCFTQHFRDHSPSIRFIFFQSNETGGIQHPLFNKVPIKHFPISNNQWVKMEKMGSGDGAAAPRAISGRRQQRPEIWCGQCQLISPAGVDDDDGKWSAHERFPDWRKWYGTTRRSLRSKSHVNIASSQRVISLTASAGPGVSHGRASLPPSVDGAINCRRWEGHFQSVHQVGINRWA